MALSGLVYVLQFLILDIIGNSESYYLQIFSALLTYPLVLTS